MLAPPLVVSAVCLALVAPPTLFAVANVPRYLRNRSYAQTTYEDKDGAATAESQRAFSSRPQQFLLLFFSIAATGLSLAIAILRQLRAHGDPLLLPSWLLFGSQLLTTLQSLNVFVDRRPVKQHNYAFFTALSYVFLILAISLVGRPRSNNVFIGLWAGNFAATIFTFITCLTFPRRPEVFYHGAPVDGQRTVSALSRLTYSWVGPLLALAKAKGELEMEDIPSTDRFVRAAYLNDVHPPLKPGQSLIALLFRSHLRFLLLQYVFTVFQGVLIFAPQISLYQLLRALEDRHAGKAGNGPVWQGVILLGLSILVLSFADGWMWLISYAQIQTPVRVHLSALIFSKSMRRKDVKGTSKKDEQKKDKAGEKNDDGEEEEEENKTRQGTINLVGIDAKRVSDFSCVHNWFLSALIKLSVSFAFLINLIGWKPVVAGLAVQAVSIPINIYFSKRYSAAQNGLMKVRDKKLAVLNEVLSGIRHIKFAAFEKRVQQQIKDVREKELKVQFSVFLADTMLIFCWISGPVLLSAVSLSVYAVTHGGLTPSIAFTTLGVLGAITVVLAYLPELTTQGIDAWVSINRIQKYLNAPEKQYYATPGPDIEFKDATISWPTDEEEEDRPFLIRDINLKFPKNELSVISGQTGSGKSLLLSALIGEVDLVAGKLFMPKEQVNRTDEVRLTDYNWLIPSAVGFVSQQPWIENATFRDNILFGLPYDKKRYESVIFACSLEQDRKLLSDGDVTEIGANGINLSGGQKWRITLARALYSRCGILVMDDIFSAVDAHVGRHIFENALCGKICQGRTIILATHHVSLVLSKAKYTVHLSNGTIEHAGSVTLLEKTGEIQAILDDEQEEQESNDTLIDGPEEEMSLLKVPTNASHHSAIETSEHIHINNVNQSKPRRLSMLSQVSEIENGIVVPPTHDTVKANGKAEPRKFVEDEKKEVGRIAFPIYIKYLQASGSTPFWIAVITIYICYEAVLLGRAWWLTMWTRSYDSASTPVSHAHVMFVQSSQHPVYNAPSFKIRGIDPNMRYYLGGYLILAAFLCVGGAYRYFIVFQGSIRGSRKLFDDLTYTILRAPLRWLDTVPVGRVLNRFTSDFNTIDSELAMCMSSVMYNALVVLGVMFAGVAVSPLMIIFAIALLLLSSWYALYYLEGAREMKRLESNAKSPIFELFGAALSGVGTIRAFKKTDTYIENMFARIDKHGATLFYMWICNRWVTCRLGIIGAVFGTVMAAVIASMEDFDPALAGFALSFGLQYTDAIYWALRQYATVEMAMNSAERVIEYSEIEIEKQDGITPPASWPSQGQVDVEDLVISYAPDLPPVLRGISFNVKPNERCAVVGRTGAGKSSLTLALFRFLEAREGSIHIDGFDISKLTLHDLRSRLAIIPQDPVLFSGTVRSNLDPFDEHDDNELLDVLKRVHISASEEPEAVESSSARSATPTTPTNANPFSSLSTPISEGGHNLSQGQRQLLCLARAIISRPKILILDEATSAVDKATDELIQRSIREQFKDSTLIVIAHRLSTIADFDRVLVLGDGKVLEYDKPSTLVEKEGGEFWGLVERSGEKEAVKAKIYGERP